MNVLRDLAEERIRVSEASNTHWAWPSPGVAVGEGHFGNAALRSGVAPTREAKQPCSYTGGFCGLK